MAGFTVQAYPTGQIKTILEFVTANGLNAELVETRDGQWFGRLDAYVPAHYDSAAQKTVGRKQLSTDLFSARTAAQTDLAAQLTKLNTLELANGTKLDISGIRVTSGTAL